MCITTNNTTTTTTTTTTTIPTAVQQQIHWLVVCCSFVSCVFLFGEKLTLLVPRFRFGVKPHLIFFLGKINHFSTLVPFYPFRSLLRCVVYNVYLEPDTIFPWLLKVLYFPWDNTWYSRHWVLFCLNIAFFALVSSPWLPESVDERADGCGGCLSCVVGKLFECTTFTNWSTSFWSTDWALFASSCGFARPAPGNVASIGAH